MMNSSKIRKVFLFGSKAISNLTDEFVDMLNRMIDDEAEFLIGDCNGVDATIQKYLSKLNYKKVTIYASFNPAKETSINVRNNIGNWEVVAVFTEHMPRTYAYRREKDYAMINYCDLGIGLWDGKSRATHDNYIRLGEKGKLYCDGRCLNI